MGDQTPASLAVGFFAEVNVICASTGSFETCVGVIRCRCRISSKKSEKLKQQLVM